MKENEAARLHGGFDQSDRTGEADAGTTEGRAVGEALARQGGILGVARKRVCGEINRFKVFVVTLYLWTQRFHFVADGSLHRTPR